MIKFRIWNSIYILIYINLNGGLVQRSDASRIYIIRANDQRYLTRTLGGSIKVIDIQGDQYYGGDTFIVPFDVEPTNYLVI